MSPAKKRKGGCPDCGRPVEKGGFCEPHYQQDYRRRRKEATVTFSVPADLKAAFFDEVPEASRAYVLCGLVRQYLDGLRER